MSVFNKALEFKSKEAIEKEQFCLLREELDYISKQSSFYRSALRKKKIKLNDIRSIHDLSSLPLTKKEQLQKYNWEFNCVNKKAIADIVSTTGTTGDPVFIVLTRSDLQRLAQNEVYSFLCAGADDNDTFHLAVTIDNLFMAGIAYYMGIIELGASVYRAGMHNIKRQILLLKQLKPTGIMTVPSFLLRLGKEIRKEKINPMSLSIKKALLVGESIRNQDFSLSGIGELLRKTWPIDLYSTFGNSETAISYCECQYKQGAHEHSDLIITEIIDENGKAMPDRESGELVLTTLQTQGMPLLRYCTGDITFKITEPCACGRGSVRIGPILGRKSQMLKYKGTKLYPKVIENAIMKIKEVNNYVIEVFTGNDFSDKIIVKIGCDRQTEKLKNSVFNHIEAYARVTPEVELLSTGEVEMLRTENGKHRKPRNFIDHRISL